MRIATAHLESISTYGQSGWITSEKGERETNDDFELRTWKERAHYDNDGECFIPCTSFKNMIAESAKFTPRKGPSGGTSTWTKNFEAGVMVVDNLMLGVNIKDVQHQRIFVPSDGKRGGSKRVWKHFPIFPTWKGSVEFYILDDTISEEIFRIYLEEAGKFIGLGWFRPRRNGFYGRFKVLDIKWSYIDTLQTEQDETP